jgi:hypothetical protein
VDIETLIPRSTLANQAWPAYVLDAAGKIFHVNAAWDREACNSAGLLGRQVIGTAWLDHIAGDEVRAWHRELLDRLLHPPDGASRGRMNHVCACNTAERFRIFSTHFDRLMLPGEDGVAGVLVTSSLLGEAPIDARYLVASFDERRLRQPDGTMLQCSGCRRMSVAGSSPRVWEFVPKLVWHPRPDISHGICALCREVYYGTTERYRLEP